MLCLSVFYVYGDNGEWVRLMESFGNEMSEQLKTKRLHLG